MHMHNVFKKAFVIGFWVLCAAPLGAQIDTGTIAGTVTDSSQAVLPAAAVRIRNDATGIVTTINTNELGQYVSPPLQPGPYTVTVEAEGFQRTETSVRLELNRRVIVDMGLQVGELTETVTITAETPLLETESSTMSDVRPEQAVKELPLNGRNFAMLLGLSTGVVPAMTQRGGPPLTAVRGETANSLNGMGFRANRFLVDGLDNTENHNGQGILIHPAVEAIQEISIQQSVPPAEFARGGANINVRLKSGGQAFHGTLFEFFRNSTLDAKNFFDSPSADIPPFVQNQFGFVVGGPVILGGYNRKRDKTFFLFNYEGLRTRQAQTFRVTTPLPEMRQGDFSRHPNQIFDPTSAVETAEGVARDPFPDNTIPASLRDSVGAALLGFFPDPNLSGLANNFLTNPSQPSDSNNYDIKIDQVFGESDNAFFRFSRHNFDRIIPGALPAPLWGSTAAGTTRNPLHQFVMSWTHMFSPTVVNEARAGVGRLLTDSRNANFGTNVADQIGIPGINSGDNELASGMPQFNLSGFPTIGDSGFRPARFVSENWQYSDNLSWHTGPHSLKFGVEYIRRRYNLLQTTAAHGIYTVNGVFTQNLISAAGTGISIADLLLGVPAGGNINALAGMRGYRRPEFYLYAQDSWKITSALTLNIGLRYESFLGYPWIEVFDRQANFLPERGDVFVVNTSELPERSGTKTDWNNFAPRAGLAYKLGQKTVVRAAYGIFYQAESMPETNLPGVNPPFTGSTQFNNDQADYAGARRFSDGFDLPDTLIFPTEGAALFTAKYDMGITYAQQWNFGVQRQLPSQAVWSVNYVGTKGTGTMLAPDINQPRPGPGAIAPRRFFPRFGSIREFGNGGSSIYHSLQTSLEKRMTDNLGFLFSYTWSKYIDNGSFIATPQNVLDLAAERGLGREDMRQRFIASYSYALPFGKGQKFLPDAGGAVDAILGGWQINGIASVYAGLPVNVSSGINTLNGSGGQRADRIGDGKLSRSERTIERFFDVDAFAVPGQFLFGNGGRNILTGPRTIQSDFSLFKTFSFDSEERYRLQFRSEFFNIFNTPQFNDPASAIGRSNAGTISSAGSKTTFQRTSRQIQFALKFFF